MHNKGIFDLILRHAKKEFTYSTQKTFSSHYFKVLPPKLK